MASTDPTLRKNIKPGMFVAVILKKDQTTGVQTEGYVKAILTSSPQHPHGIKVKLEDGQVGRVCKILDQEDDEDPDFEWPPRRS